MKKQLVPALLLAGASAHANGFLLNEFDAKAVGRGNASAATDIDPSSIYYNIGGLAGSEGTNAMLGASLIQPLASFTDTSGTKTESNTGAQFVPGVFVSSRVTDLVAVGVGFYTPFGLAISWPDSSPQNDVVKEEALHTFFITPSAGVNLGAFLPGLTAGAGIDLVPATVELSQSIYFGSDTGNAHLGGTAFGVGGRVGAMYRPASLPQLSVGAMWRSDVKLDFSGTGDFDAPAVYRPQLPPDGDIKTSLTLPQSVTGGAAYRPMEGLEIEANVIWTNWAKFKQLDIQVPSTTGMGTMTITGVRNYSNTTSLRVGAEYQLPTFGTAVRVGYIYDPTPIPPEHLTAELPDVDRNDVTLGASKAFGNYAIHAGLLWVLPSSRKTADTLYMPQYKGTYDVSAFVAAVTLSAKLK